MSVRWFSCRWCGDTTAGVDSYVICVDCVREFELRIGERSSQQDGIVQAPVTPEIEARLRRLLDW